MEALFAFRDCSRCTGGVNVKVGGCEEIRGIPFRLEGAGASNLSMMRSFGRKPRYSLIMAPSGQKSGLRRTVADDWSTYRQNEEYES